MDMLNEASERHIQINCPRIFLCRKTVNAIYEDRIRWRAISWVRNPMSACETIHTSMLIEEHADFQQWVFA